MSTNPALQSHATALVLVCALLAPSCKTHPAERAQTAFEDCRRLLFDQQEAWNNGDLEAFVAGYRDSDETVFCTKKGTKLGRQAVLASYKLSYPDKKSMGHLKFSDLKFSSMSKDEVLVRGRWYLHKENATPSGSYVLVMRLFPNGWKVVLDYSTSDS